MGRKLASLQRIVDLQPIPGYDRVELATVLGWQVIVKKGEFKVGDLSVYFEPDSKLPKHEVFAFMEKAKYRVKTIKMCKTISQGLLLPVGAFDNIDTLEEGLDLTELLGVTHYEKDVKSSNHNKPKTPRGKFMKFMMKFRLARMLYSKFFGSRKSTFPTDVISKTDETNVQNKPGFFRKNAGLEMYITEKLEGQSGTYIYKNNDDGLLNKIFGKKEFIICSRSVDMTNDSSNSNWAQVAKKFDIENILKKYYEDHSVHIAIQGEIIGPGIQKNIYKLKELDYYIFNIKDVDNDRYFTLDEKLEFSEETGLKLVPLLEYFFIHEDHTPKDFLDFSTADSSLLKGQLREGIVVRSIKDDRISFKARSPEYLLKWDKKKEA